MSAYNMTFSVRFSGLQPTLCILVDIIMITEHTQYFYSSPFAFCHHKTNARNNKEKNKNARHN